MNGTFNYVRGRQLFDQLQASFQNEDGPSKFVAVYAMFRPQAIAIKNEVNKNPALKLPCISQWIVHNFHYGQGLGKSVYELNKIGTKEK